MPEQFAPDQFDEVPRDVERIGVHRARRPHVRTWLVLLIALAAVLVVIGGSYLIMRGIDQANRFVDDTEASSSASASAENRGVDKSFAVTVLNGTTDDQAHKTAKKILKAADWTDVTATDSDSEDIATTAVYVVDESYLEAGQQVADDLGIGQVSVLDNYNNPITVVLGADFLSVSDSASSVSASPASASSTATASATESATATASEDADDEPDTSASVFVYNGTRTSGLAATAKSKIEDAGWSDVKAGNASSRTQQSTVYYAKGSLKSTAKAIAKELGIDTVKKDSSISVDVAVVLGSDYS